MRTLVLKNVPDTLYLRLKALAEAHRNSISREALSLLESAIIPISNTSKPNVEETLNWLRQEVWILPILDDRNPDEIMGYNEHGLFD